MGKPGGQAAMNSNILSSTVARERCQKQLEMAIAEQPVPRKSFVLPAWAEGPARVVQPEGLSLLMLPHALVFQASVTARLKISTWWVLGDLKISLPQVIKKASLHCLNMLLWNFFLLGVLVHSCTCCALLFQKSNRCRQSLVQLKIPIRSASKLKYRQNTAIISPLSFGHKMPGCHFYLTALSTTRYQGEWPWMSSTSMSKAVHLLVSYLPVLSTNVISAKDAAHIHQKLTGEWDILQRTNHPLDYRYLYCAQACPAADLRVGSSHKTALQILH